MSLYQYFLDNAGAPIHKNQHYFPIYERHLARFAGRPSVICDANVGSIGSCGMWKRYFGSTATIVMLTPDAAAVAVADEQVRVRIGDPADTDFLTRVIAAFGPIDVFIDDGSHRMDDMIATFEFIYPRLARDGVYIAEDLHTAYWPEYGGGLRRPGTFIEIVKDLIDELNADHMQDAELPPTAFTRTTASLHIYDSMVVLERGTIVGKQSRITGG